MSDLIAKILDPNARELDLFLLTAIVFLPALAALLLFLIPSKFKNAMRWLAIFAVGGQLTLSLCAVIDYYHRVLDIRSDRTTRSLYHPDSTLEARVQQQLSDIANQRPYLSHDLIARRPWIEQFNIDYALGADGINLVLVILSGFVTMTAIVAAWFIDDRTRGFLAFILLLQTGVTGAFLSIDFFLFYVFYELMLIPMYFLIGLWGGARRKYAAVKFVIYTLLGSVGILGAMIALATTNVRDFVDQEYVRQRASDIKRANPNLTFDEAIERVEIHSFDLMTLARVGKAVMLINTDQAGQIQATKIGPQNTIVKQELLAATVEPATAIARLKRQPISSRTFQYVVFILLFIGFAVKLPIVPLHSWLPDAHVEAPTPISMILAGILLKVGGYGFLRIAWPLCPLAAIDLSWWMGAIGVIGIIYGAVVALGQTDFKRLLAYSSVSHMGFVLLGIAVYQNEQAVSGAIYQMIAHGVTASALFFCVGVVYDRAHHRDLNRMGGLSESMPFFTGLSVVLFFASMGLPGLCGFIGEFLVLTGSWRFSPGLTTVAVVSTILTACYLLWTMQRVFYGVNENTKSYPDLSPREWSVLVPFTLLAIILGVAPVVLFSWVDPAISGWVRNFGQ